MSLSWVFTNLLAVLLLPPANGLLLAAIGGVLLWRRQRWGRWLVVAGIVLLWLCSLHIVAVCLARPLEMRYPAWSGGSLAPAQAIVVLGGGRQRAAPEFAGADTVSSASLERLRYGAYLARQSGLPLLLTGGLPDGGAQAEAETMQITLQRDFGIKARWLESASNNTLENARFSAALLQAAGIKHVVLVTHAWHMPRAVDAFSAAGLQLMPAPMGYLSARPLTLFDFLPRAEAMAESKRVMHEWIGLLWYALRR